MSKMIQIRNVPETVHRRLKAHAALEGMSLSEYLLAEVRRAADRPSLSEMRQRLAQRAPVKLDVPAAEALREQRDSR
jgi:plasmid stability protein